MTRYVRAGWLAAALVAAVAAGAPAGFAQEPPAQTVPPNSEAETLLRAAIEQLVQALGQTLHDVPLYAVPEVNRNGDIILRRLNPPTKPPIERGPTLNLDEAAT